MSRERLMSVLLAPHVSEKSTRLADSANQYVFRVRRDASKDEIRRAVELMFEVHVESVRVARLPGKPKAFGRVAGRRSEWKKAYVRLAPGEDIEFLGAEA